MENALPILREFGFPAVIYVVVNAVGRDNFWHDPASETRIPMLDWDGVRALQSAGWEIGCHTLNHARLPRLSPDAVRTELTQSRTVLAEKLGVAPVSFANPYGDAADDPAVQALIREARGPAPRCPSIKEKRTCPATPIASAVSSSAGTTPPGTFILNMTRGRARL